MKKRLINKIQVLLWGKPLKGENLYLKQGKQLKHTIVPMSFERDFPIWDKEMASETMIYID